MVYTLDQLREIVTPIAEKYKLKAVYVFGSYARGEATEDSDVDLLVDTEGSGLRGWAIGGLYNDLEEALGGKGLDLVTVGALMQPDQMKSDKFFRENVTRDRRELYAVA